MVTVIGTQLHTGPIVQPHAATRLLNLRYLRPLAMPNSINPVLADMPACSPQQRRSPSVAVVPILAGQLDDGPGQSILVLALCRLIALRAPWLFHQLARPPYSFRQAEYVCSVVSFSRQAAGVILPCAIATSICRIRFTTCSAVRLFPFCISCSPHSSLSQISLYKERRAIQTNWRTSSW